MLSSHCPCSIALSLGHLVLPNGTACQPHQFHDIFIQHLDFLSFGGGKRFEGNRLEGTDSLDQCFQVCLRAVAIRVNHDVDKECHGRCRGVRLDISSKVSK